MMRVLENLLQPVGILWMLLWIAAIVLFRRRQFRWSATAGVLAAALWIVGATPLPALLLADLERLGLATIPRCQPSRSEGHQ